MNTKAKWFDLPVIGETIDLDDIALRVFKNRFSEETFNRLEGEILSAVQSSDDNEDVRRRVGLKRKKQLIL